jgi:hypothetical protein
MNLQPIIQSELEQLKAEIIFRHEQAGQVASGKTRASFEIVTSESSGELWGNSYVGVLERGRKPGKVPYNFRDILKRWATAKGISFSSEADMNRWAYFVAKKIREEGTLLYARGRREDIFETPINNFIDRITNRIGSIYQSEIENTIFAK